MSVEILKAIKIAEAEAELIRKQAVADSRQIIADANTQGKILTEQLLNDAEAEAGKIIEKAEKEASREIDSAEKEIADECAKIKELAGLKIDKAAGIAAGRIMSIYGNR